VNQTNTAFDNLVLDEEYATIGKTSGIEKEEEVEHPFNAERVSVSTQIVPLSRLLERLEAGTISAPEIQRNDNLWNDVMKSRLIESLMIKIPLPLFYVAADLDENWKIVDGLQRICTIRQFMLEKTFRLNKLEFLIDLNGSSVDDLPVKYRNRIKDTQFQFAVIGSTTPQEVQRNIFKRLNTGGLPLTLQEVRHALYFEHKTNELLIELVKSEEFLRATNNSIDDSRMAARELVLRFISFLIREPEIYTRSNNMEKFLSDTMLLLNTMPDMNDKLLEKLFYKRQVDLTCRYKDFDEIKTLFLSGMERADKLFGTNAFRKSTKYSSRRAPVNKSIFECVAIILSQLCQTRFEYLLANADEMTSYIHKAYQENTILQNSISRDSQKFTSVQFRFKWFHDTLALREYGGKND